MQVFGWQSVLLVGASVQLAAAAGCGSSDNAGLFDPLDASSSGGVGTGGTLTPAAGRPSSGGSAGAAAPSGGARAELGGEAGEGGEAPASGGRSASGGRGANGGRPSSGGRAASEGGNAAGRATGGASAAGGQVAMGGSEPGEAGSGGVPSPVDCDDGDPCTVDEPNTDGGCHHTPKCLAASVCEVASCEPESGECSTAPVDDGSPCDDGLDCTEDACAGGVCSGQPIEVVVSRSDQRAIPDGNDECTGDEPLLIELELDRPGSVGKLEVALDLHHHEFSDLRISLARPGSNQEVLLVDSGQAPGAVYEREIKIVLVDGGDSLVQAAEQSVPDGSVPEGRYAPAEPLASFSGEPLAGVWQLRVLDRCDTVDGTLEAVELRFELACAVP